MPPPVLAFGGPTSTRPPPYSAIEHVDVQDQSFVLFLANCDAVDTTIRKQRASSEPSSSIKMEGLQEGEKPCTKTACIDLLRRINVAGKKNRDEREDLAYEQQVYSRTVLSK